MDAFFIYSIKVAICIMILYICIKAFLSKETFFHFNRITLLTGVLGCLLIPFIYIEIEEASTLHQPMQTLESVISIKESNVPIQELNTDNYTYTLPETNQNHSISKKSTLSISQILLIIYFVGVFINMILLLYSFWKIKNLIKFGKKTVNNNYILVVTSKKICPFSWKKYIVIWEEDYKNNPEEIILHEIAHIKYRHSLDVIFIELILLFQWFNPAIWLLKRELKNIHEYQADMSVLKSGIDATKYQLLLVKKAVGASSYTLANSFNHSKIKKRITMMLKEKSNKWGKLKLMLLLPATATCMYAFAQPTVENLTETATVSESTNILSEDKITEAQFFQESKEISTVKEKKKDILKNDSNPQKKIEAKMQKMHAEIQKMQTEFQKEIEIHVKEKTAQIQSMEANFVKEMEVRVKDNPNADTQKEVEAMRKKVEVEIQKIETELENEIEAKAQILESKIQKMETEIEKEMELLMKEEEAKK